MNKAISTPIAIIIVLIIAIMVGGVVVWQYLSVPESEVILEEAEEETADWKVYRNQEYGFEFRYPRNYKEYTDPTWIGENELCLREYTDKNMNPNQLSDILWYNNNIFVKVVLEEDSFDEYIIKLAETEKQYLDRRIINSSEIFIDGKPAIQQELVIPPDYLIHGFGSFRTIINSLPDMLIVIHVGEYGVEGDIQKDDLFDRNDLLKLHNKILSTFKFID